MDLLELKSLFETSVRCLAISMQEAMKRQLTLLDNSDFAMNDHLVESMPTPALYEDSKVETCLDALKRMHDGLQNVEDFERWSAKNFGLRDWDAPQIATLMMAFVAGYKNENLPKCAIEVQNIARELLRLASKEPNDKEYAKLLEIFMDRVKETTDKYHIDLEWSNPVSLPLNYLTGWFQNQYWKS